MRRSALEHALPDPSVPAPLATATRIVTERETGKPRGFGFIEFYDIPTAESAIRNLNGSELMGRSMRIVFAEGGPPGEGGFRGRRDGASSR